MCLNRSLAHAGAGTDGLLRDVSASRDGACTSPAHSVASFRYILVSLL